MSQVSNKFDGAFDKKCQENSVPSQLLIFLSLLLEKGGNFSHTGNFSQPVLSIAQLITSNFKYKKNGKTCKVNQHLKFSKRHETPLLRFLGLNIHNKTRDKSLIIELHRLGLSISYPRVIALSIKKVSCLD